MPPDEQKQLIEMIDAALAKPRPTKHLTLLVEHGPSDDPLPFLYDYLESLGCAIAYVSTFILTTIIKREVVIRTGHPLWDGST